jgi:hypothetical protein
MEASEQFARLVIGVGPLFVFRPFDQLTRRYVMTRSLAASSALTSRGTQPRDVHGPSYWQYA